MEKSNLPKRRGRPPKISSKQSTPSLPAPPRRRNARHGGHGSSSTTPDEAIVVASPRMVRATYQKPVSYYRKLFTIYGVKQETLRRLLPPQPEAPTEGPTETLTETAAEEIPQPLKDTMDEGLEEEKPEILQNEEAQPIHANDLPERVAETHISPSKLEVEDFSSIGIQKTPTEDPSSLVPSAPASPTVPTLASPLQSPLMSNGTIAVQEPSLNEVDDTESSSIEPMPCPLCQTDLRGLTVDGFRQHVEQCIEIDQLQDQHQSINEVNESSRDHDTEATISDFDLSDADFPPPYCSEAVSPNDGATTPEQIAATKFLPITDVEKFLLALAGPGERSTKALYVIAENAQNALKSWQDEWMLVEKRIARATERKAHNPRPIVDEVIYEDMKEADLYGFRYDSNPLKQGRQDPKAQRKGRMVGGRELRHRMPNSLIVAESDDAGAIVDGPRVRKPRQHFGSVSEAETRGQRLRTASEAPSSMDKGKKRTIDETPDVSDGPRKRGRPKASLLPPRIRAMRNDSLLPSTATTEVEDELDADSDDVFGTPPKSSFMSKRRGRPPKHLSKDLSQTEEAKALAKKMGQQFGKTIKDAILSRARKTKGPSGGINKDEKKPRVKSEKRSASMVKWWAKRKGTKKGGDQGADKGDMKGEVEGTKVNGDVVDDGGEALQDRPVPDIPELDAATAARNANMEADDFYDSSASEKSPEDELPYDTKPTTKPTTKRKGRPLGIRGKRTGIGAKSNRLVDSAADDSDFTPPQKQKLPPPKASKLTLSEPKRLPRVSTALLAAEAAPRASPTEYEQYQQLATPGTGSELGKRKRKPSSAKDVPSIAKTNTAGQTITGTTGKATKKRNVSASSTTEVEEEDDGDSWDGH
ncbi:MAG: hypothetical protein M1827_003816 [Pycnora praestabilis]|nr:MAG: hypothetical protein M1827_003816 [Pycnora praestabilis]